jgi:hypothetical protein
MDHPCRGEHCFICALRAELQDLMTDYPSRVPWADSPEWYESEATYFIRQLKVARAAYTGNWEEVR